MAILDRVVQVWLVILTVFEIVAIVRTSFVGEPLTQVSPIYKHAAAGSPDFGHLHSFSIALLACIRLTQALHITSPAAWSMTMLTHNVELAYFTYITFFREQALPVDPRDFNLAQHGEASVIFGGVAVNAALFTFMYARALAAPRKGNLKAA